MSSTLVFDMSVTTDGQTVTLSLLGELDRASVPLLDAALTHAELLGASRLMLDCNGLQFCDSAGLHALLSAHRRFASRRQSLEVHGLSPFIRWLVGLIEPIDASVINLRNSA